MDKKTIVYQSNFSRLLTGFGRVTRTLLRYLHKTGKYNIVEAANGLAFDSPETQKQPWTCHGTAASPDVYAQLQSIQNHGERDLKMRAANYGYYGIDKIVEQYKPAVVICAEDVWAFDGYDKKTWFNKTNPILWTTLDSLSLLPSSIDAASKYDNYFVWATFAEEEFKDLGYSNVKTLHGCIDPAPFYRLEDEKKIALRNKFGIEKDTIIIGLVSRNQLRKGFPHLILALKELKARNPDKKIKLLLHTSWKEGFNLKRFAEENDVDLADILTTYYCRACRTYEVKSFCGHDLNCKSCGSTGTCNTVDIIHAVDDAQLNEVYNLMDIACLPLTSGGLEFFCLESKLCELPLLVTNYSCGTDAVKENSGGFALDWVPDVELGSDFIKSRTKISSIVEKVEWLISLPEEERRKIGCQGREFVLNNYSIDVIGKKWEEVLDNLPSKDWDDPENLPQPQNPSYIPPPNLSPQDFVLDIFANILHEKVDKNNSQVKHWVDHLIRSNDHQGVYNHFVNVAQQHNAQLNHKNIDFSELLDATDDKRLLIVMPESAGDVIMVNSLIPRVAKLYPEFRIYFATKPQFKELVEHLPQIHKVLDWLPAMDDIFAMTGRNEHKGFFDVVMLPHGASQRFMTYQNRQHKFRAEWLPS
jgi:glycosyltransferase involved in cell wall biosynthesis